MLFVIDDPDDTDWCNIFIRISLSVYYPIIAGFVEYLFEVIMTYI